MKIGGKKKDPRMDPFGLVPMVEDGGVIVWEIFSWSTLGRLVPVEHGLNIAAFLSIVANHVHPFMSTVYASSGGYFQ